jgi:hypothetical protein
LIPTAKNSHGLLQPLYDFTPTNNVTFVIIAETLPVLFIIILFETKTNNNDNIFHINSDVGCLTRHTNFIEAPMRIVRVRDHADKGEQAILLVKYDDCLLVHVV